MARDERGRFVKGSGVKIIDKDLGYNDLVKRLIKSRTTIQVGILEADAPHEGGTVGEIAEIHEYGKGHNPERSFVRGWFDGAQGRIRATLTAVLKMVVKGPTTVPQALEIAGLRFAGEMKQRISAGIAPPNAQSTIDRKGSSTPLVNEGVLRSSISHKVEIE